MIIERHHIVQKLFEGVNKDTKIVETKYSVVKSPILSMSGYEYEIIKLKRYYYPDLGYFTIGFGPRSNVWKEAEKP